MPPRKKEVAPPVEKTKSKRKSKKVIQVVAVVTPDGIQGNFVPEPRKPLIAHLDVHSNEIIFRDQPLQYDPTPPVQPEPYYATADDIFATAQESIDLTREEVIETKKEEPTLKYEEIREKEEEKESRPLQVFSKANIMIEFANANKNQKLPERTSIACFWCAHTFDNQPCIVPEREVQGVYKVYGNFCTPECAIAYLLNESLDPHVRWERMALLNRLYDTEVSGKIYPAPPRESLAHFGGVLTIESYRSTIRSKKVRVDLHIPPIVSIIGSIDTKPIDFFDTTIKNTMTLLPYDKIQQTEEGLRLKRSKPLKDKESTLDACINIEIRNTKK
jgi:hypothetical protein